VGSRSLATGAQAEGTPDPGYSWDDGAAEWTWSRPAQPGAFPGLVHGLQGGVVRLREGEGVPHSDLGSRHEAGSGLRGGPATEHGARLAGSLARQADALRDRPRSGREDLHQDQDGVFTSYRRLRAVLIQGRARLSFSENGARGNTLVASFFGRLKVEN